MDGGRVRAPDVEAAGNAALVAKKWTPRAVVSASGKQQLSSDRTTAVRDGKIRSRRPNVSDCPRVMRLTFITRT
jgi:hypothetical protein